MIAIRNPSELGSERELSSYWMKYETSAQDDETTRHFATPTISKVLGNLLSNPLSFVEAKSEKRETLDLSTTLIRHNESIGKRDNLHQESDSEVHDSGIDSMNCYYSTPQNKRRKLSAVDEETSDSGYSSLGPSGSLCREGIQNQAFSHIQPETYEIQITINSANVKNIRSLSNLLSSKHSYNALPIQGGQDSPTKPPQSCVDSRKTAKEAAVCPESSNPEVSTEIATKRFNSNLIDDTKEGLTALKTKEAVNDSKSQKAVTSQKTTDKGPTVFTRGLRNRSGYHCYRNACIQALGNDKMFRERVLLHRCNRAQCSACLLKEVFSSLYSGRSGAQANDPRQLPAIANILGRPFNSHGQQDCIEYSLALLNKLEEHGKADLINVFRGYYSQSLVCKCGKVSSKKEAFQTLNLPMPVLKTQKSELELDDLLKCLVRSEFIKDYRCDGCKKLGVEKFSSTMRGYQKNTARVKIESLMNFYPYLKTKDKGERDNDDHRYKLSAVICHTGSLNSGHYYTYIRPTKTGTWFLCDDSRIDQVSSRQLVQEASRTCYGLLYERIIRLS